MVRSISLLAYFAVLSAGCGGHTADQSRTEYPDSQPASSPALDYLPRDVRLVLVAGSVERLQDRLGWDALAARHRGLHERAVAEIVQLTGADLLDPAGMAEAGLEPGGACGMALTQDDSGVFFAQVADSSRLKTLLYRTASKLDVELDTEVVADSLIIRPRRDDDWRVVMREQTAFFVISHDDASALARRLATIDRAGALSADPRVAGAMDRLRFGADVAGIVSVDMLLREMFGVRGKLDIPVAFGLELSASALRFKARVPMDESMPVRNLARTRDRAPALVSALTHEPLLLLAGHVDATALAEAPWAHELEELFRMLGVDFASQVAPLVAGDVGLAVVRTGELELGGRNMEERLGVEVAVEVADAGAARALLAQVMEKSLARQAQAGTDAAGNPTYTIAEPSWKDIRVGVRGSYLYVSTEPGFAERLGAPGDPPVADSELAALLTTPRGALWASLDALLVGLALMPAMPAYGLSYAAAAAEPMKEDMISEEYRRKEKELEEARERMRRAEVEVRQQESRRQLELVAAFGASGIRAELDEHGVVVYGGQFLGDGGLARVLDAMLERIAGDSGGDTAAHQALRRADEEVWKLTRELRAIGERDRRRYEEQQRAAQEQGEHDSARVRGALDKKSIQRAIRQNLRAIKRCYERELLETPDLQGKVTVAFTIEPDGTVTSVTVPTGINAKVDSCIARQVQGIEFPKPRGGGIVKVTYPFVFKPAP